MNVTYGLATHSHIEELKRLRIAYLQADFGNIDNDVQGKLLAELSPYLEQHLNGDLHAHVAYVHETIVGTCWLLVTNKPASLAFPHGRTGAILNVYVEPAYRKQGIARQLMLNLIEQARGMGLDRLELRATAMGYALYKSIGFEEDESSHRAMNYRLSE